MARLLLPRFLVPLVFRDIARFFWIFRFYSLLSVRWEYLLVTLLVYSVERLLFAWWSKPVVKRHLGKQFERHKFCCSEVFFLLCDNYVHGALHFAVKTELFSLLTLVLDTFSSMSLDQLGYKKQTWHSGSGLINGHVRSLSLVKKQQNTGLCLLHPSNIREFPRISHSGTSWLTSRNAAYLARLRSWYTTTGVTTCIYQL